MGARAKQYYTSPTRFTISARPTNVTFNRQTTWLPLAMHIFPSIANLHIRNLQITTFCNYLKRLSATMMF